MQRHIDKVNIDKTLKKFFCNNILILSKIARIRKKCLKYVKNKFNLTNITQKQTIKNFLRIKKLIYIYWQDFYSKMTLYILRKKL